MSTHIICFRGEIRKLSAFFDEKKAPYLLLCDRCAFEENGITPYANKECLAAPSHSLI